MNSAGGIMTRLRGSQIEMFQSLLCLRLESKFLSFVVMDGYILTCASARSRVRAISIMSIFQSI